MFVTTDYLLYIYRLRVLSGEACRKGKERRAYQRIIFNMFPVASAWLLMDVWGQVRGTGIRGDCRAGMLAWCHYYEATIDLR